MTRLPSRPEKSFVEQKLIHELFEEQVRRTPDAIALACAGSSLTYAELNARANSLGRHLRSNGVGPDQLVGLCVNRGVELVVGILGILKAGGAYVPLDPSYPVERLVYMLNDAKPRLVLIEAAFEERMRQSPIECIALDKSWEEIAKNDSDDLAQNRGFQAGALAYVIYTSGSTGRPKGVMVEHRNVVRLFAVTNKWFQFNQRDVWTLLHSFAFDFSVWELWGALLHGGRLVIVPYLISRSPQDFYDLICAQGVTVLNQTPSAFSQLIVADAQSPEIQHSLRLVIFGGEVLEPRLLRPWITRNSVERTKLVNMYGITETTVHVTYLELCRDEIVQERGHLIGRPIDDLKLYLFDRSNKQVPDGVVGEIHVGGGGVARGYLNRPDLTAERFIANPIGLDSESRVYKTGDLGRIGTDGVVEFLGRNDNQVKIRGFRIELGEIEAQLVKHELVREAVTIVREDSLGYKRLASYLTVDMRQLKEWAKRTHTGSEELVGQWKKLYEGTYSDGGSAPSFVGWNSSYTGKPLSEDEMAEWRRETVERIKSLRPRRVLEIGCGVGLMLESLAPGCEMYRGTDLSEEALNRLGRWIEGRDEFAHVHLEKCSAHEIQRGQSGGYDTVILNSVVQYFPDVEYLRAVLKHAAGMLSPGGHIFVGDVRHFGLLEAFHTSVQLERAGADEDVKILRARVIRAIDLEKELLVDPGFFETLHEGIAGIETYKMLLKRGRFDNELTRYRYDVVLKLADGRAPVEPEQIRWCPREESVAEFYARIDQAGLIAFRLGDIDNRSLSHDLAAVDLIRDSEEDCRAGALRQKISAAELEGEDPVAFYEIGERYGYEVGVGWQSGAERGRFFVEGVKSGMREVGATIAGFDDRHRTRTPIRNGGEKKYSNDPLAAKLQKQLASTLREYMAENVPSHMIPTTFTILDAMPLTPNGKLDRAALPADVTNIRPERQCEALQGEIEELLAGIWQELLHVEPVGRKDNFFDLGGHSLLVVQMLERLRRTGLSIEVRDVFGSPTLASMARSLVFGAARLTEVPPNRIPTRCDALTPQMLPLAELNVEQINHIVRAVPGGSRNIQDIYPLAPLQEGILFHHRLNEQKGDAYVLMKLLALPTRQCLDRFIRALQTVIDRHDVLRTAVLWQRLPLPMQIVLRRATLPVEEVLLDGSRDPVEQLLERMGPEQQNLDLRQAPPMRLQVACSRQGGRWYALLRLHHLVCDNESLETMLSEVMECLSGREGMLPDPLPYRNHVAQTLVLARTRDDETFFRQKYAHISETTAPFGLSDVRGNSDGISEAIQVLDPVFAARIRRQARGMHVSVATLFHAAWSLVVARTTGREELVYGTVLLGRLQGSPGAAQTVGMFINTLPLKLRIQDATAKELVQQTQQELIELIHHEQASLALAQRCSSVPGSAPLFTSLLNYRHGDSDRTSAMAQSAGITILASRSGTNYPITLSVSGSGDGFLLYMQTSRGVSSRRLVDYTGTAMLSLIEALEGAPHIPSTLLEVIPTAERGQVLESFNSTQRAYPREKTVHSLFEDQVRARPNSVAAVYGRECLTYAELNERANQVVHDLLKRGVRVGDHIPVLMQRGLQMLVAQVAVLKSGAIYVPLDASLPVSRLEFMIRDCGARRVLTDQDIPAGLDQERVQWISLRDHVRERNSLPTSNLSLQTGALWPAYVMYTSGSTGVPKGVIVSHRAVVRLVVNNGYAEIGPGDSVAHCSNPAFDASTFEIWGALLNGACVFIVPHDVVLDPTKFSAELLRGQVTVLWMTAALFTQYRDPLSPVFGGLRYLLVGGDTIDVDTVRLTLKDNAPEAILNGYGPTECTTFAATHLIGAADCSSRSIPIGKPISNTQIYILDRRMNPAPIGVIGEIYRRCGRIAWISQPRRHDSG